MKISRNGIRCLVVILVMSLCACSTPAEKVRKFMTRGNADSEKGEYVKAILEYRNAFTIDPEYIEAYYQAGQADLRLGKVQEAYAFFMKTVAIQPDHVGANLQLGRLYLANQEFGKAREKAEAVLGKAPGNQQAILLQGGILLSEHKALEAKTVLEKLLPRPEKEVDFYLLLATAYGQLGDAASAESLLHKGFAENPKSIQLLIGLANFYLEQKQPVRVEETLKQIIALEPDRAEHVLRLASYLWHVGRKAEADNVLQGLLARENGQEERWAEVAGFYMSQHENDRAGQVARDGVKRFAGSFRLRFLLEEVYLARGEAGKALAVLKECLDLDQDDPAFVQAQRRLAELYYRVGDVDEAEKYVAAILKKSPNEVDGHLLKGEILVLKGDFDQAIAEYRTVMQARPKDITLYPRLADVFVRNRQISLALDILKQGLQIAPEAPEVHRALARLYILDNKPQDALAQLQKMVDLHPEDPAAGLELADFYMGHDGRAKAMQIYTAVTAKFPNVQAGWMRLAGLYALEKQDKEAAATVAAGIAANPGDTGLLEQGAQLMVRMGRGDEALALTRKMLSRHPDDAIAFDLQGNIHAAAKDYATAEHDFRRALELQADLPETAVRLARLLVLAGKADQAIADTERLLAGTPDSPASTSLLLAELYEHTGRHDKSLAVYDQALTHHPEDWFMMNNLAYALADGAHPTAADLNRAEELSHKAQVLAPGNAAVLDTLGWLSYKMGKTMQARAALTLALEGSPNNPVFSYHLGMVLVKAGKKDEARTLLEKVVQSPGSFSERDEAEKALKGLAL